MSSLHLPDAVELPGGVRIPLAELDFAFVRSPGPGGQHVNKTSTRVELRFHLTGSPSLPEALRDRCRTRLQSRLNADGELVIASSRHRSQTRNRVDCIARFAETMAAALRPPAPPRRKTRPGRAAVARRLDSKKKNSQKKTRRRRPGLD
ncbi:MAG: alternative ribosome rescue aminoacyl-tRNA hydrolase ArfB [Candidatus Latescibacteria bacterium]|jgi:ribosome-associated protein|nr:aminoacyl-tRNA hydrolase [Gemmatimonadaceae bacterium]MDP7448935.1 alternative ribosome rescue aminoacyl-tRNA hydrolase ArfB [Candidatus Latescibacterota bacterium]HJP33666.1 alternative ribosome rescue aminoacyl-tRNA hydrolase ArfB [Candidatus Latescibacterota bacterium]|tara:strand:- start:537 stop:983 length:447 start_codon:yes stop_codon:yes gene_type:complete